MCQTKKKHDSLVLSRSDLWMVWRWHVFRMFTVIFYGHGSTCLLNLSSRLTKRHGNENPWTCLEKDGYVKRALGRTLHQNRKHVLLILCPSFSHKPSFWI